MKIQLPEWFSISIHSGLFRLNLKRFDKAKHINPTVFSLFLCQTFSRSTYFKMKIVKSYLIASLAALVVAGNYSCQQAGVNKTGSEFIPDMAHSTAYEANVLNNYSLNTWDKESTFTRRELSQPRLPVSGTVPRGYAGIGIQDGTYISAEDAVMKTMKRMEGKDMGTYPPNGSAPYYFADTEEDRLLATERVRYNPFPITVNGLARGQELYNVFCGICHGEKGDGNGYLVRENGGKYPAQPANFLTDEFSDASNGRYYHSIIYGRNAMGAYADKLSYEERWQVIHYIRSLQAKDKKVKYNADANELKQEFGVPEAQARKLAASKTETSLPTDPRPAGRDDDPGTSEGGGSE